MSSPRKTAANRRNALASTGPKTPEGKTAAARNSLRHGLRAATVVLAGERAEDFETLHEALRGNLQPVGELEEQLVERVAVLAWRLRRVAQVEAGLFGYERARLVHKKADDEAKDANRKRNAWAEIEARRKHGADEEEGDEDEEAPEEWEDTAERLFDSKRNPFRDREVALAEKSDEAAAEMWTETSLVARAFDFASSYQNQDLFSKLARYETSIDRAFYRALHQLERVQSMRAGVTVPPPVVLDVTGLEGNEDEAAA